MRVDRFTWQRALREDHDVTGNTLLVLLVLATYFDGKGSGFASIRQLAAGTGLGESTVRRHLTQAIGDGWLDRTKRGARAGNGRALASTYETTQPLMGEHLTDTSTAHERAGEEPLNRSIGAFQPLNSAVSTAHQRAPLITFPDDHPSPARRCGHGRLIIADDPCADCVRDATPEAVGAR
jgi:hypothetical protein